MGEMKTKRRFTTVFTGPIGEFKVTKDANPKTPGIIKVYGELRTKKADGKYETRKGATVTVANDAAAQDAVNKLVAGVKAKGWAEKVSKRAKVDSFDLNSIPAATAVKK